MISLDKCNGSCDAVEDLSTKICVLSETKYVNVKVFHKITRKNEVKTLVEHISCDCKCKFDSTTCNSNQKIGIIVNVNVSVKSIISVKEIITGILVHIFMIIVSI